MSGQLVWSDEHRRWYRQNYDLVTKQWKTEWILPEWDPGTEPHPWNLQNTASGALATPSKPLVTSEPASSPLPRGLGARLQGTNTPRSDRIDPSYRVRYKNFFTEGRVFAVIMNETAGNTEGFSYNSDDEAFNNVNIHRVKYADNLVHTQTRRFVVVRQKREYCYACPIFTYSGRGTTKRGVKPAEHAIIYSMGKVPVLLSGESGITKASLGVVMARGVQDLDPASRVYFGIHHPIQYNVKVKEIGRIHQDHISALISAWKSEDALDVSSVPAGIPQIETDDSDAEEDEWHGVANAGSIIAHCAVGARAHRVSDHRGDEEYYRSVNTRVGREETLWQSTELQPVQNPRAFFKKGRVFDTPWLTQHTSNSPALSIMARFTVIRSKGSHSIVLPMQHEAFDSIYGTSSAEETLAVTPVEDEGLFAQDFLLVKVENSAVELEEGSRIDFSKPFTVSHDIKIRNIGRVVANSIWQLDNYFARGLGLTKP